MSTTLSTIRSKTPGIAIKIIIILLLAGAASADDVYVRKYTAFEQAVTSIGDEISENAICWESRALPSIDPQNERIRDPADSKNERSRQYKEIGKVTSGAKFIRDDATGGDCTSIGTWDGSNRTCTISLDYNGSIVIESDAIILDGSSHTITGSIGPGVYLKGRKDVIIKNLNVRNFDFGIYLTSSNNNMLSGNTISSSYYDGIFLSSSNNNILSGNIARSNYYEGIYLSDSSNNTVSGNTANSNCDDGIYLSDSKNSILSGNIANSNYYDGIDLSYSSNNTLKENVINSNLYGIFLGSSRNNTLRNNVASSNGYFGIYIAHSSNNLLSGNMMMKNWYNFGLFSLADPDFENTIETSNLAGGRPIFYVIDAKDIEYGSSANAATFYCINCENVTIKDMNLTYNLYGLFLWNTIGSRIQNINAWNNEDGIYLNYSRNNLLTGINAKSNLENGIHLSFSNNNTLSSNAADSKSWYGHENGIYLDFSKYNTLSNNTVPNNERGIYLYDSMHNMLSGNTVPNNDYGIYLYDSINNTLNDSTIRDNWNGIFLNGNSKYNIIFNNILKNTDNADDYGMNIWNITKTAGTNIIGGHWLGGNFWSDYTGQDTDGDGLGNTMIPYNSSGRITNGGDLLPLTQAGASITIYTDKSVYEAGDKMYVGLNLTNSGESATVGLYIWIDLPSGNKLKVVSYPSITLPAGLDYKNYPWKSSTLPNITEGNYAWHGVLKNITSENIISESISPWFFIKTATETAENNAGIETILQEESKEIDLGK